MNKIFLSLLFILSATRVFAEGPCGKGQYVRRCFGGCGVPYQCRYVCSGPHHLQLKSGMTIIEQVLIDGEKPSHEDNEEMELTLESLQSCH